MQISLGEGLTALATLLSPLIAVQVTRYLDDRKQRRDEKQRVFKMLWSTRAQTLDQRHVESLNSIDVVFSGKRGSDVAIRSAWKAYLDHLSDSTYPKDHWGTQRLALLIDLLHAMSQPLGYALDKTEIKKAVYHPDAYVNLEQTQAAIRTGAADILAGKRPLPVYVVNDPPPTPPAPPPPVLPDALQDLFAPKKG